MGHVSGAVTGGMKGLRVSAVVSGLVGLVCIGLLIAGLVSKDTIGGKRYGIILDAGSSGTRVYVYNWPGAIPSGDEYPRVTPDPVYLKIKPGLSELGGHTTGEVVSYLEPLLTYGEQNVPADKEYLTPIFLRATAGLRLLPQDQQDALMHGRHPRLRRRVHPDRLCPAGSRRGSGGLHCPVSGRRLHHVVPFVREERGAVPALPPGDDCGSRSAWRGGHIL